MNCDHKWSGDVCTECGVLWRVWAEKEIARLRALIEPAKRALEYVKGVNADWPIGQDDDRDAVIDALAKALEPFEDKQPGCGHFGVNT
jgi:hypothetical protein